MWSTYETSSHNQNVQVQYVYHCCLCLIFDHIQNGLLREVGSSDSYSYSQGRETNKKSNIFEQFDPFYSSFYHKIKLIEAELLLRLFSKLRTSHDPLWLL